METRELIRRVEEEASLPTGPSERFAGYVVIGLPFQSGHVLALRRFIMSRFGFMPPLTVDAQNLRQSVIFPRFFNISFHAW